MAETSGGWTEGPVTWPKLVTVLVCILTICGAVMGWSLSQMPSAERMAKVETRQASIVRRLDRIETKIDQLLVQTNRKP